MSTVARLTLFGSLLSISPAWSADASAIREAATKAVALIQTSQKSWFHKESCESCHQQDLPAMAFRAAREHGIPVDEAAARADAVGAFSRFSNFDRVVQWTDIIDPPGDAYHLLAAEAAGVRPSLSTAAQARLLAARQEADGHWEPIDVRPPQHYNPFTDTALAAMAILGASHPSQAAETRARVERAKGWLLSHTPKVTEERVFQLVGAFCLNGDHAVPPETIAGLKATQRPDGGWNSREGLPSDAYSTGEALWALHSFGGVAITDASWQRGIDFLLRTQAKDGSWHVVSRLRPPAPVSPPYVETGYPYGHDQFISIMGASWAVIALADALGPEKPQNLAPLEEAEVKDVEPWVETVLFGTAADVKKLLDSGFDPNSATKSGGTTALMLAAPDVEKMTLLLGRGADVNRRSKTRYTALMMAAQYPNSAAAMNLLLDRGAQVRLPAGQGAPLYNASALILAAFSGNAEILERLRKAGDRLDSRMFFVGMFPASPALEIVGMDRVKVMAALLDGGANANETDDDGISLLGWAAIANRLDMARLLIHRGADVNHVDKKGMTPLLYAASIDFGDPSMINLLLKSGARPDARTKEGKTALDLARGYGHTHLVASLRPAAH
jgi:ankyrin repeat protein